MNAKEKWNLIVSLVANNRIEKEDKIQKLWEDIFSDINFFGYSRISGEVDRQRKVRIGTTERVIPDIIIRDVVTNEVMFVVELKQHNLPFQPRYKEQLFSYMRLLRLTVGVLVCDRIYLYYLDSNDTESAIEIPFSCDENSGIHFVELFSKGNFSQQGVYDFITKHHVFNQHVKEIEQDVLQLDIGKLVENYYQINYTQEEINEALRKFYFKCVHKNEPIPITDPIEPDPEPISLPPYPNVIPSGYERDKNETTQNYVKRLLPLLDKAGVLSNYVLGQLQDKDYCKLTFNLSFSLLEKNKNNIIVSGHCRYWTNYRFKNYYVCSQWWKELSYDYTCRIYKWLEQLFASYQN